jgi:hypothetical protein
MKPTKIGNRFIVLGRPAPAAEQVAYREPTPQGATSQRIVVIRHGALVGSRPGR